MKHWERAKRFNKHHIKNRSRGGKTTPENLLRMDIERHNALHFLFGNLDFQEIASLLIRVSRAKNHYQK